MGEARAPLLELDELRVWYGDPAHGRPAVDRVSLRLERGMRLGLVGESGSGKTTTIMACMGLLPAGACVAGDVRLNGEDVLAGGESGLRRRRWRDIAMVFQGAMNAFNPVRTIQHQIVEPMRLHGTADGSRALARARELLELVGIPPSRADRYAHELSGGMRQRAAIAMALACEPKVLLADEPTTALDTIVQAQILDLLASLTAELELGVVLVTHDLGLVGQMCDRIAVMRDGVVVEQGATEPLFANPVHPYTAQLLAATPDLEDVLVR